MSFLKGFSFKGLIPVMLVWLFGLYPVLALFAHNADQLLIRQIAQPAMISVALSTLLFGLFFLVLRNASKASIATIFLLLIFWYYGFIARGIMSITGLKHWHLMPLLFFIYFHLVYLINKIRKPKTLDNFVSIVFYPVLILLIFNFIAIVRVELKKTRESQITQNSGQTSTSKATSEKYPDIYLIILDEYGSIETVKEEWGYDNSLMADSLRSMGFFVATKSRARYNQTLWNMASLLNMNYLTDHVSCDDFIDFSRDPASIREKESFKTLSKIDNTELFNKLNDNSIFRSLKEKGYKIIVLEGISQHQSTLKFSNTDLTFSYLDSEKSEKYRFSIDAFSRELIRRSIIFPLELVFKMDKSNQINYTGTKYILNYLKNDVNELKGPKFVYAHILCPHSPHVFDRHGNSIPPVDVESQRDGAYISEKNTVNAAYLEQYIFISGAIRGVVNSILQNGSDAKPVIIIQSDHGPRPYEVFLKDKKNSFKVFNSFYIPGNDYQKIHDSISPVNTMRLIFNRSFGDNYNMLEDR
jgi:hypothetical protein